MAEEKRRNKDISNLVIKIVPKSERTEYPPLPEMEWLPATLANITEKITQNGGKRARFEYQLLGELQDRKAWCSVPLHPKNSEDTDMYKWLCTHLGVSELKAGDFSFSAVVGKKFEIMLESVPSKKDKTKSYQNIIKVRPLSEAALENIEVETEPKKGTRKSRIKKPEPQEVVEENESNDEDEGTAESEENEGNYKLPF